MPLTPILILMKHQWSIMEPHCVRSIDRLRISHEQTMTVWVAMRVQYYIGWRQPVFMRARTPTLIDNNNIHADVQNQCRILTTNYKLAFFNGPILYTFVTLGTRAGSGSWKHERRGLIYFQAGRRKRPLNQALSVSCLILFFFFWVCFVLFY